MLLRIGALLSSSVGTGEGGAGIRPGVAAMSWTGYPPTITGVRFSFAPGVGSATWTGQTPTLQVPVSFAPGVASMTWTGPAPTITGLVPDGAIVDRSGNEVVDRSGNNVINLR